MPTITTVNKHLKNPSFFWNFSKEFWTLHFDHIKLNNRKSAYKYLKNIFKKKNNVLIYPSGSIYTSIEKRFSKSISKLSIENNLNVIAWRFYYSDKSGNNFVYKKDILNFILMRFLSDRNILMVEKVKIFSPNDYESEENTIIIKKFLYK